MSFYRSRGPGKLVSKIQAPTLLIQGTADNLFTLQEAVTNYDMLRAAKVPVKMLWFCGGHGVCLTNPGRTSLITTDTIGWLDHYLKNEVSRHTGPAFEWVDQDGVERTGSDYPLAAATPLAATGSGTLTLSTTGGSGPVTSVPSSAGPLGAAVAPITPAKAASAINVTVGAPKQAALVVGAPTLHLTYHGLSAAGGAPVHTSVYGQIVDDATGKVLGNQVTPIPVTLDGASHAITLPLEILSATDHPGEHFTLQVVASTVAYQTQRATGAIDFTHVRVVLPTVNPVGKPPLHG